MNGFKQRDWVLSLRRTTHISTSAVLVLLGLLAHYNAEKKKAWPKQTTLSEEVGLSVSTVNRALQELVTAGAIKIVRKHNAMGHVVGAVYTFSFDDVPNTQIRHSGSPAIQASVPFRRLRRSGTASPERHVRNPKTSPVQSLNVTGDVTEQDKGTKTKEWKTLTRVRTQEPKKVKVLQKKVLAEKYVPTFSVPKKTKPLLKKDDIPSVIKSIIRKRQGRPVSRNTIVNEATDILGNIERNTIVEAIDVLTSSDLIKSDGICHYFWKVTN